MARNRVVTGDSHVPGALAAIFVLKPAECVFNLCLMKSQRSDSTQFVLRLVSLIFSHPAIRSLHFYQKLCWKSTLPFATSIGPILHRNNSNRMIRKHLHSMMVKPRRISFMGLRRTWQCDLECIHPDTRPNRVLSSLVLDL